MMYERIEKQTIEAMKLTLENQEEVRQWCNGERWSMFPTRAITGITIPAWDGPRNAAFGDYVVKLVSGTFTVNEAELFEKHFTPINNTQPPQGNEFLAETS